MRLFFYLFFVIYSIQLFSEERHCPLFDIEKWTPVDSQTVLEHLDVTQQDFFRVMHDLWVLVVDDMGSALVQRIPTFETLCSDAAMDAILRQIPAIDAWLKGLEETNPVNAAVVRDLSKTITLVWKEFWGISVDRSGRLYDISDLF